MNDIRRAYTRHNAENKSIVLLAVVAGNILESSTCPSSRSSELWVNDEMPPYQLCWSRHRPLQGGSNLGTNASGRLFKCD